MFQHNFEQSPIPRYRELWDRVELLNIKEAEDVEQRLLSENFALVWTRDGLINMANKYSQLSIAKERFTGINFAFPIRKDFRYKEDFDIT